jgi:zinc transport system ATP-binding protein
MGRTALRGMFSKETPKDKNAVVDAMTKMDVLNLKNKLIGELSGGQRQRVMIARALCAHPQILILDEPTSSIDIKGQKEIYELLKLLNKTITIVVVSHDISVILEYASKAAHINKKLSYHDISNKKDTFHTHGDEDHFCEIELLQMLGSDNCSSCEPENSALWREKK